MRSNIILWVGLSLAITLTTGSLAQQPDLWIQQDDTWLGKGISHDSGIYRTGERTVMEGPTAIFPVGLMPVRETIPVGLNPLGVGITPNGSTALVTNFYGQKVSAVDLATHKAMAHIPIGNGPSGVAITPNGTTTLVTNFYDDTVSVVDLGTLTKIATIRVVDGPRGVAITPDGSTALVAHSSDDTVSVVDLATHTLIATIPVGDEPYDVAITPNGSTGLVQPGGSLPSVRNGGIIGNG